MKKVIKGLLAEKSKVYRILSFFFHWQRNIWLPIKHDNLYQLISILAEYNPSTKFMQVGSNDGRSNDPIYPFIKKYGWSGYCIEPIPDNFAELTKTYSGDKNVILLNTAIGNDEVTSFYYVNPIKAAEHLIQLPSWYNQLASFDRDLVLAGIEGEGKAKAIDRIDILSTSFSKIIDEHSILAIDLLHIDAEGADWKILATFPFNKLKPQAVIFEHNHLTLSDYKEAIQLLKANGYCTIRVNTDTFAYHKALSVYFRKEYVNCYRL